MREKGRVADVGPMRSGKILQNSGLAIICSSLLLVRKHDAFETVEGQATPSQRKPKLSITRNNKNSIGKNVDFLITKTKIESRLAKIESQIPGR